MENDSVTPCGHPLLLTGIVDVSARIKLVCGIKINLSLAEEWEWISIHILEHLVLFLQLFQILTFDQFYGLLLFHINSKIEIT